MQLQNAEIVLFFSLFKNGNDYNKKSRFRLTRRLSGSTVRYTFEKAVGVQKSENK